MNISEQERIKNLKLVNSSDRIRGVKGVATRIALAGFNKIFNPIKSDYVHTLPEKLIFKPFTDSKVYGTTHYGIMISDLPAPFNFLACASILGNPGFRTFDLNFACKDTPHNMVTISHGTNVTSNNGFYVYTRKQGFNSQPDGSLLQFGDHVEISGTYPNFALKSHDQDCKIDLQLTATGEITWFARSFAYDHLSLLTRYTGTIEYQGEIHQVSGLCTYEHARGVALQKFNKNPIPFEYKVPWDFFTYQVLNLDKDTQLVMTHCRALNDSLLTAGYIRKANQASYGIKDYVHFEVLELEPEPFVDGDGIHMLVPKRFRWIFKDQEQGIDLEINATVDCKWLFGLGRGYISGYQWHGYSNGQPKQGRGYVEYVDVRYPVTK